MPNTMMPGAPNVNPMAPEGMMQSGGSGGFMGGGRGVCYDWQKGMCSRVSCR